MDKPDPPPEKSTGSYVSPKLREKLEGGGRTPRDKEELPAWAGWLVVALLLIAVAAVGLGIAKSNAEKKRLAAVAHADSLRAAAAAESVAAVQRDSVAAESTRAAQMSPKDKKAAAKAAAAKAAAAAAASKSASAPASGAKAATPASAAAPAPAAETRHYGLIVGEYLDEDKANSEKDRLAGSTGLPGRVVPVDKGASFRVILGSFDGKAAAEKAAGDLSGKGLVNEAQVTVLPK